MASARSLELALHGLWTAYGSLAADDIQGDRNISAKVNGRLVIVGRGAIRNLVQGKPNVRAETG
jgi:hypothetical protein